MNRLPRNALLTLAVLMPVLIPASGAFAQDRSPVERQQLLDLAFTIGESHALRQICQGADDQYWRSRMVRLTDVEKADQAFDAQLRDKFNVGFASRQGEFPECDDVSRRAEQQTARKGQALAAKLARSMRTRAPADQAPPETVADN